MIQMKLIVSNLPVIEGTPREIAELINILGAMSVFDTFEKLKEEIKEIEMKDNND